MFLLKSFDSLSKCLRRTVEAARLLELTAQYCTLTELIDDKVRSSFSLMGGEGDMIRQSLHREEVFIGGAFHVLVQIAYDQDMSEVVLCQQTVHVFSQEV